MTTVVVSQPMYLPWVGMLEQVRMSDVFVHYDDVQLPQGRSFTTRVQLKTSGGIRWMTVPVMRGQRQRICDTMIDESQDWRRKHLRTFELNYSKTPFFDEARALFRQILHIETNNLAELSILALERITKYLGIPARFVRSSQFPSKLTSTERLVDLVAQFDGDNYVTGQGAWNYLDHEQFKAQGIGVQYMAYDPPLYEQPHGTFTPYVSAIDFVACCGSDSLSLLKSGVVPWDLYQLYQDTQDPALVIRSQPTDTVGSRKAA